MRHLLLPLTVFCILISTVNCNEPSSSKQVDLESIYEQNLRDSTLATGWYYILENETGFKRQLEKTKKFYFIDPYPILTRGHFDNVKIAPDFHNDRYFIAITARKKYHNLWADATEKSIGKQLGFIIDDKLINAPMVNLKIQNGLSSISGYDKKELEAFKKRIKE
jgi:preprotein translocase subunit SecD